MVAAQEVEAGRFWVPGQPDLKSKGNIVRPYLKRNNDGSDGDGWRYDSVSMSGSCRGPWFIPNTQVMQLTAAWNSSTRKSSSPFWPPLKVANMCVHMI